jgi:hypothetical protein
MEIIEKVGYKDPTPIQRQAIPIGFQVNCFIIKSINTYNYVFIFRIVISLVLPKLVLEKHWLILFLLLNGSSLYLKWNGWKMLIK